MREYQNLLSIFSRFGILRRVFRGMDAHFGLPMFLYHFYILAVH